MAHACFSSLFYNNRRYSVICIVWFDFHNVSLFVNAVVVVRTSINLHANQLLELILFLRFDVGLGHISSFE